MPIPPPGTYNYTLDRWTFSGGAWFAPAGTVGVVDFRPEAAQAQAGGTPQGFGFFALDAVASIPPSALLLGADLLSPYSDAVRLEAEQRLGLTSGDLSGYSTLLDAVWALMTTLADPTWTVRASPLLPSSSGQLTLFLGGHSPVRTEPFTWGTHPATPTIKATIQRRIVDLRAERGDSEAVRRHLGWLARKYGVSASEFVRPGSRPITPLPPRTTITDPFTRGDQTGLGTSAEGWSWTTVTGNYNIVSNEAQSPTGSTENDARAESDLAGDDHYAEATCRAVSGTTTAGYGTAVRFAAAATTYYRGAINTGSDGLLYKVVTGTPTILSGPTAVGAASGVVRTEVDGSDLSLLLDTVLKLGPITDTSITTNLRTGLSKRAGSVVSGHDGFTAADLGGAAAIHYPAIERSERRGANRGIMLGVRFANA